MNWMKFKKTAVLASVLTLVVFFVPTKVDGTSQKYNMSYIYFGN